MKLTLRRLNLPLKHEFTISRETMTNQSSVLVELEHDGIRGYGEVTENAFYGHTFQSNASSLRRLRQSSLERYMTESPLDVWASLQDEMSGDMFAMAALDIAAHDLQGKRLGVPTWQDWGLEWNNIPDSSFTIGIDTIERMVAKLEEEPGWGTYKIKLGTTQDVEIITELRRYTDAVFRVDANCAWSVDETISKSKVLADLGVEFIEQPLVIETPRAEKLRLFANSALPIIADEDCQVVSDIEKCSGLYHGVNVKICKCGGLTPALDMLVKARRLGLKTMVGCMVESSVGISGAAQLLPLLDFADLDGAVLLRDEPCSGVAVVKGKVVLSSLAGCGADLDHDRLAAFLASDVDMSV